MRVDLCHLNATVAQELADRVDGNAVLNEQGSKCVPGAMQMDLFWKPQFPQCFLEHLANVHLVIWLTIGLGKDKKRL
jgi:hypothetical protein